MIRLEVLVDAALMWSPTCKCKVASLFSSWSLNQLLSKQRIVNQVRYILLIFSVFLFSLTVISCKSSDDDDVTSSASSSSDIVSVSDSGGYIQIESTNHSLDEGDVIRFTTTDTLPKGLALATDYYVVGTPSTSTFFVSATESGTPIVYTDGGTGTHSWQSSIALYEGTEQDDEEDTERRARASFPVPSVTIDTLHAVTYSDQL